MQPDRSSPEAVVAALYDVISGPADQPRDWARLRALFLPDARLRIFFSQAEGPAQTKEWTPEEFAAEAEADYRQRGGFWEREVRQRIERFGSIAHVWSIFESRQGSLENEPFARGINSIQLALHSEGWAVASLLWDVEQPHNPILR